MKMETSTHAAHTLTQLAQQFDHWRQHRTTRAERIPQPLSGTSRCLNSGVAIVAGREVFTH